MIKALMNIGKYLRKEQDDSKILESLLDTSNLSKVKHLLEIVIEDGIYKRIDHCEFSITEDSRKANSILYKKGSGNGKDFTPTSRLTYAKGFNYEKTYKKKLMMYFKDIEKISKDSDIDLVKIRDTLTENTDKILEDMQEIAEQNIIPTKDKDSVITLKIDGKNLISFEFFKNDIMKTFYEKASKLGDKKTYAKNKMCCLTHEVSEEVCGNANNFSFMTWDKYSFISGGFNPKNTWKNYPVSPKAYMNAELGKNYIEENLIFNFCDFYYYLIPKLYNYNESILKILNKLSSKDADKNLYMKSKNYQQLVKRDDRVFKIIKDEENQQLSFDYLFFVKINSAVRILLHLEDIKPRLIRKLYDAQSATNAYSLFKRVRDLEFVFNKGKNNEYTYKAVFTFDCIRKFFYKDNKKGDFDKQFLEIINKIFYSQNISYDFLLDRFVKEIQYTFRNNYNMTVCVTDAFLILHFLHELKILHRKENIDRDMNYYEENEVEQEFSAYFKEHGDFFNTPERLSAFLTGVYVQKLLNIQYRDRKASPFLKRLNGLKVRKDILRRIFTEAKNKYIEYDKSYYKKLETLTAKYMTDAGEFTDITNNDMSFYFATGMSLEKLFLKKEEEKKETDAE